MKPILVLICIFGLTGCTALSTVDDKRVPLLQFGAIADCQYADRDDRGTRAFRQSPQKLREAVQNLNGYDLAFVVHVGDFIDRDWESFDVLTPITDDLIHPLKHVLGNHDFDIEDEKKLLLPKRLGMPSRYYHFAQGDWVFVVLDGNDVSHYGWPVGSANHQASQALHAKLYSEEKAWNGAIGADQLAWLRGILATADIENHRVILFSHFPIYPEDPHNLWNSDALISLLDEFKSPAVWINGHNHVGAYGERNGVHYVTLQAMLDAPENAYSLIQIYEDRINIKGFGAQKTYQLLLGENSKQ